jgi:large repetitive protein
MGRGKRIAAVTAAVTVVLGCATASGAMAATPELVKDIAPLGASSHPASLTKVGDTLFFVANDGAGGRRLWMSDGTEPGTHPVTSTPVEDNDGPSNLTAVGNRLFFVDTDSTHGRELWISDGTPSGTHMVRNIQPGYSWSNPRYLTAADGGVYFSAFKTGIGEELWFSDGTGSGTHLVRDIARGPESSHPRWTARIGNRICFSAIQPSSGAEPWCSNGTKAGTRLIRDIRPGDAGSSPDAFVRFHGRLYFEAWRRTGSQLWKTTGTRHGTGLLVDLGSVEGGSGAQLLGPAGGKLYFLSFHGSRDQFLWSSAGSRRHTHKVAPLAGRAENGLGTFAGFRGRLFFTNRTHRDGREPWVSDGTRAGTRMLKNIAPGNDASNPGSLTPAAGVLYFAAQDATHPTPTTHGDELWSSDGSAAGTAMVADINPGPDSSQPAGLVRVGSLLFFSAYDPAHGYELWKLALPTK